MTPTLPLCKIEMLEANVDALDRGPQQYLTAQANCRVKGCGKDGKCQTGADR